MIKIENLPVGWELKPLSEVCVINPRKSEVKDCPKSEKITFLSMESVGENGEIHSQEIRELGNVFKGYTYFKKNDILFAKITPCMENGKGTIANIDTNIGFGSTEFHILRSNEKVIPEWIYRFLGLNYTRRLAEMNMTGSAGQKRVPKTFFDRIKISVPPINTQIKIIEILEKAEKLKELRIKADKLTNSFLISVFYDLFGDPLSNEKFDTKKISELTSFISYGFTRPMPHLKKGIPIITSKNVTKNKIDFKNVDYTDLISYNKLSPKDCPKKGDILYTKDGRIGEAALVETDQIFCISQAVAILRPIKSEINPLFLEKLLNHPIFKSYINKKAYGVALKHISITKLKNEEIICPSLDLQNEFIKIINKFETLKNHQIQSKQKIDSLFETLMQKAFKGELVC